MSVDPNQILKSKVLKRTSSPVKAPKPEGEGERHRHKRCAVFVPAVLRSGDLVASADILNMSAGGALIRTTAPLNAGDELDLDIEGYETLQANVVHGRDGRFGLAFDADPRVVSHMLARILANPNTNRDAREYPRRLVLLGASYNGPDGRVDCRILNISARGAFMETPHPLPEDTRFDLTVARFGTVATKVVWSDEHGMGIEFAEDPETVRQRFGQLLPAPKTD